MRTVKRLGPAFALALLVNVAVFGLASLLARERPLPQDMTQPIAVNLVQIAPEESPPLPEPEKEPEPPLRQEPPVFVPDLVRPRPAAPAGLEISLQLEPLTLASPASGGELIFTEADLDQPPTAVMRAEPAYPYKARQRRIEGEVTVKFLVKADGSVGRVQIIESQPQGLFDAAVLDAVARWRFEPGRIADEPGAAWVVSTIVFDLDR